MKIVNIVSIVMIVTMLMVPIVSAELTITGKNWLAINAGSNNCFANSGISYNNPDGEARTGGTSDVVASLLVAHLVGKDTVIIIANINYQQFKVINGVDLGLDDIGWVYNNDGHIAGTVYCTSGPIPPVPESNTGILTSVGMLGLFIISRRYKVKK